MFDRRLINMHDECEKIILALVNNELLKRTKEQFDTDFNNTLNQFLKED